MSKLTGKSTLSIDNAPKSSKIGLIEKDEFQTKSFRLSADCIATLEVLTESFSKEAGFKIAMGKVVELSVAQIKNKNLKDLLED